MNKLILILLIFSACFTYAQSTDLNVTGITDKVVEWRRHIHQHPELSFEEKNTSAYVDSILKSFGNLEVLRPTETSVLGILRGRLPGKTVAFRADMDALPVQEETGLPYASVVSGVSHACGHDVHTAILLGTASILSSMQKEIQGNVYFIFQPGEEKAPGGAQAIIRSGALKGVDAIFGLHIVSDFPAGHIGILPVGAASTASDGFTLVIQGQGSHGSMPQSGIDPIVVAADLVMSLQTIVSRNINPDEMAVISVGKFQSGNAPNVIPVTAELAATIRTVTDSTRQFISQRVKSMIENITKAYGATYHLNYIFSYPAIQNNDALSALAEKAAIQAVGMKDVTKVPRMPASEDFSYYKEVAPICFFVLGTGNGAANHNPAFNPDESAFANGVKTEVQIILDYLNQK